MPPSSRWSTSGPGRRLTAGWCRRLTWTGSTRPSGWPGWERTLDRTDPARSGVEVFAIYLLPEARGQGTGRQLMDAAEEAGWAADGAVKQDDDLGFTLTEVRYRRSPR
jgi:GNAT superfamily N-acetyltransferase